MMKTCWPRQLLSIILLLSFVCATLGAEGPERPAAVLRAAGKVQVNGTGSGEITTLFSGDTIQTDAESLANIIAGGSSVLVMPNASIKFLGDAVELAQGGMVITTSEGMAARAYGLTITPTAKKPSKFEVAEYEDSVVIAARQGNVTVTDGQQTWTTLEVQETRHKKKRGGAIITTHSISGKTLGFLGAASGATVAGVLIAESNKKKKCVSPSGDKKCKCKTDKNGKEDCEED